MPVIVRRALRAVAIGASVNATASPPERLEDDFNGVGGNISLSRNVYHAFYLWQSGERVSAAGAVGGALLCVRWFSIAAFSGSIPVDCVQESLAAFDRVAPSVSVTPTPMTPLSPTRIA